MNQFKNNIWPRPRDENTDFILTAVVEHNQAAMVSAMTVWNDKIIYATSRAGTLPRLFAWDGETVQEMATPPWTNPPAAGTTFQINGLVVYNGQLWLATSPNAAVPPVVEIWYYDGTLWTDAKTLAGWGAAPLGACGLRGMGWLFVFNGIVFVGQDTTPNTGIFIQGWNGTTWLGAVEQVGLTALGPAAGLSDTPTSRMHAPILNNVVYVGAYDLATGLASEVYRRDTAGTWTLHYTFPGAAASGDPVETLVKVNSQIYAAQGGMLFASNDIKQLACVTSVPTRTRNTNLGFRSGLTLATGNGREVAFLASPRRLCIFDPSTGSLETVVDYADDAPLDMVVYHDRVYISQGSEIVLTNVGAANLEVSIRIARLD
jgi:hypothetical protein